MRLLIANSMDFSGTRRLSQSGLHFFNRFRSHANKPNNDKVFNLACKSGKVFNQIRITFYAMGLIRCSLTPRRSREAPPPLSACSTLPFYSQSSKNGRSGQLKVNSDFLPRYREITKIKKKMREIKSFW